MKQIFKKLFAKKKVSVGLHRFADGAFHDRDDIAGVFDKIYRENMWGNGSGGGSLPLAARPYVDFLSEFMRKNQISSVLDYGCGDWQFSRHIDWGGIEYTGVDVAEMVIKENALRFGGDHISFLHSDTLRNGFDELPSADMFLSKDVFQHLSNSNVKRILDFTLSGKYKYALITNDFLPGDAAEILNGDTRPLDLRCAPFYTTNATPVLEYSGKVAFLINCRQ